jgi:DNA-binding CsgD family transcriptional regulator
MPDIYLRENILNKWVDVPTYCLRSGKEAATSFLSVCVRCSIIKGSKPMRVTRRERDVLSLLLRGKTNKKIAEALGISGYTARDHVSSLLKKNGVKTRAALMVEYMSRKIQNKHDPLHL